MRIEIVTPPTRAETFTGGIWCIYQYAQGLAVRGHQVKVVPMLPSPRPKWFPQPWAFDFDDYRPADVVRTSIKDLRLASAPLGTVRDKAASVVRSGVATTLVKAQRFLPFEHYRASSINYLAGRLGGADATIATHFETALPVALHASGQKYYFAQHYEPLFWRDARGGKKSEYEAIASYHMGLKLIANSSWLKGRLEDDAGATSVNLCLNAINHEHFFPSSKSQPFGRAGQYVSVISYGGRGVRWKGFEEMVAAMKIARLRRPEIDIEWSVYGGAEIPPSNAVASYNDLGFLQPAQLAEAYRRSDILLSASWYESFPLFPLEAMATGLPVVTTQFGTEDFAFHGSTAEVVAARDPESIADGLLRLIDSKTYREELSEAGRKEASKYTWENSVAMLNDIITCH